MRKLIACIILLATVSLSLQAETNANHLSLDRSAKVITAPEMDGNYHWYVNGKEVKTDGQTIDISDAGEYRVQVTNLKGEVVYKEEMTVGVDQDGQVYRLFLIGDSTMQRWSLPQAGWGQMFQPFFDETKVTVINEARSGRSSKSYYEESDWWPRVKELLQPGDFIMIQFGINDRRVAGPDRHTDPSLSWESQFPNGSTVPSFKWYLKNYIDESKAKGAYPILCTTIRRGDLGGYGDYAQATRDLAKEFDIPLVDIDSLGQIGYSAVGSDYVSQFWHFDTVHPAAMGAIKNAEFAANGLKLLAGNSEIDKLIAHLKPTFDINISTNFPNDVTLTVSEKWPSGLDMILRADYDNQTLAWAGWFDGGERFSYENPITITTEARNYTIEAKLDTDFSNYDCNNDYDGGAEIDDCGLCAGGWNALSQACTYGFAEADVRYRITSVDGELVLGYESFVARVKRQDNDPNQLWWLEATGDNHYKIKHANAQIYLNLGSNRGSLAGLSADATAFRFEKVSDTLETLYRIAPMGVANYSISSLSGNYREGVRIQLNQRAQEDDQYFRIEPYLADVLSNETLNENISVYPNPSQDGKFELDIKDKQYQRVKVLSMDGSQLFEQMLQKGHNEIQLDSTAKGLYILRFIGKSDTFDHKVLIR